MQTKKENSWLTLKLILLMNVALIVTIFFLYAAPKNPVKNQEPCSSSKKINADIINSVTVKLM